MIHKGFYYHYKHDPEGAFNNYSYEVVGVGRHSEEGTLTVLYRPLYENGWLQPADFQARPLEMFTSTVVVEGESVARFARITDPEIVQKLSDIRDTMYQ